MPVESSLIGRTKFPSCPVSSKKWLGLMRLTTVVHRWSSTEAKKRCNYFSQSRAITKSNRPKQTFPSFDHTSDALFQPSQRSSLRPAARRSSYTRQLGWLRSEEHTSELQSQS